MWRKENPVIAPDGSVVKGGMFHHQRQWWDSPRYMRALVGGYGSGKTMISAKRAIAVAIHNAPSPYLYVSPSYKLAKRTIIIHIKNLLDGRGIKYKYNRSEFEFTIWHKGRVATIWIGSGDEPDALKGPNIGAANIDEPFIQKREVFEQIMARVRDPIARHREITFTGTPEDLNWGYDICEGDEKDNFDLEVIHASTADNKTLPEQYIDSLLSGYDDETCQAYVDGKFVTRSRNAIYKNYSDDNHTDAVFVPGTLIWTHDFNFLPMSSGILQRKGDDVFCVDEIVLDHADAKDVATEFVERYKDHKKCPIIIYGDASGRVGEKHGKVSEYITLETTLKGAGFANVRLMVPRANPAIRDGQNSLRGKICNAKGKRSFFVNPEKCPTVDKGLKTVRPKKGSAFQEDETNSAQHITTALRYYTAVEFPVHGRPTVRVR